MNAPEAVQGATVVDTARRVLALGALSIALGLPAGLPEVATVSFFIFCGLGIVGGPLMAWGGLWREPGIFMPLGALVLLLAVFAISANEPADLLPIYLFLPLFLTAPMAALLGGGGAVVTLERAGIAAASGAFLALGVALFDSFILGLERAGFSVNNPLHFAAVALALGFIAPAGAGNARGPARWLMLSGPVAGLGAVLLTGSRGPILAALPVIGVAGLGYLFMRGVRPVRLAAIAVAGLVSALLLMWLAYIDILPGGDTLRVITEIAVTGVAPDESTAQRLIMYQSALNAFLASPIYGHGMADFIATTATYAPNGAEMPTYDHLHNDIADFAVIGGIAGLLAYMLLLAGPLVQAMRSRTPRRRAGIYIAAIMATAYLMLGLTNAVFGIIAQTVLFGFTAALVVHLTRTRQAMQ